MSEKPFQRALSLLFFFLITLSTGFSSHLFAQSQDIKFKTLSSREGLTSSLTWSIAQDNHGFIWIGTSDGLNLYNGYEFKTYRHKENDSSSIGNNYIYKVLFDKKNRLWMATPGGVDRYDASQDHFIHYSPSLKPGTLSPNIFWLYEDLHSRIWAGTSDGINIFNEKTQQFERHSLPEDLGLTSAIYTLLQDRKGHYWVGTEEGLYLWNPEKKHYKKFTHQEDDTGSISGDKINTLFQDSRGNIWVGTSGGLSLFHKETEHFTHYKNDPENPKSLSHDRVNSLAEGHNGNLWVGTYDGGLNKLDINSQTFQRFFRDSKDPNSLADNAVKDVMVDERGGVWVATFRGVSFTDHYQMQFDHLEQKEYDPSSLTDNYVSALFKDSEGNIWSGNRYGISLYNPEKQNFKHYLHDPSDPASIADGAILRMSEDSEGNIWSITHTGILNRFDRKKNVFTRFHSNPDDPGSIRPHTNFVYCTRDGNVWLKSSDGLSKYNKESNDFSHFGKPGTIKQGQINAISEDSKGNFWVTTLNGIYLFDRKKGTFSLKHDLPKELWPYYTTFIYEDSNHNIWTGSDYKGLIFYNSAEDTFKFYSVKDGLPDIHIKAILEDEQGNLWVSSNDGLFRINPVSLEYKEYGLADGLKNKEFNLAASAKDDKGNLYFGGRNGISFFHPRQITPNPHPPKVVISDFQLFNKTVPIGEESPLKASVTETEFIELSYKQNVISFGFVGLNYNSTEKNKYAYKMEGFEEDWNYSGTRRHASYTNLPPGKTYTFRVKASNNDGVWNEDGAAIDIYIKPPFWQTWWFYSLTAFFGALLLYGLYRWRTRQLYLQRRKLERMVKERTEEVELQKDALSTQAANLKTANHEIKLKNKKIRRQANKLKIIDQLKSQFLANISHEFRTPLTLILVPLEEMISATAVNPETKSQLSVMDRNARRLLKLINQLLDLSKIENGNVPLELSRQNMVSFVQNIVRTFEALAVRKNISYRFLCPKEEIFMEFDQEKAENIIYNLVSNAFKFTPEGGKIEVSLAEASSTEPEEGKKGVAGESYVQITVSDSGPGISEEHLPHIFDRFYQAEGSNVRKSAGTGIGLALTKEMTELHGGKITVKSKKGQGTCFRVLLPLRETVQEVRDIQEVPEKGSFLPYKAADDEIEEPNFAGSTEGPEKEEAPLLLIVEDNKDLRLQIKKILSQNYRVEEAENGTEGWQKACEYMPDLIISDVMMPGKDGFALCSQLKSDPATSHIPAILLTARTDSEEEGLRIGADDYITKPFNAKTLALKVRNLLDTRKSYREAICRNLGVSPSNSHPKPGGALNEQDTTFIDQATAIAITYLSDSDFKTDTLYRELGMSRTLVYRKMKSFTGLSPNEFIRKVRLNKASQMLKEGKLSVSEVMNLTGFNHRSYFIKCFKEEFGDLPSEHSEKAEPSELY